MAPERAHGLTVASAPSSAGAVCVGSAHSHFPAHRDRARRSGEQLSVVALASIWGRKVSSPEADYGVISAGYVRACVLDPLPSALWVKRIGSWEGKATSTTATARHLVLDTDSSWTPRSRLGYTAQTTLTTLDADITGGSWNELDISVIDVSASTTTLLIPAGTRPAVAVAASTAASVGHSMRQASGVTADNEHFYEVSGLGTAPASMAGSTDLGIQGLMSVALVGEFNEAPQTPTSLLPNGNVTTITPTISSTFRDNNGAWGTSNGTGIDRGDKMVRAGVQVRRKSDLVTFWNNEYAVTNAEATGNAQSIVYAGTTLVRGTTYQVQVRHNDLAGAWSAYTAWQDFTPSSVGTVTLQDNPTGKILAVSGTLLDFQGRWSHAAALAGDTWQVRISDSGGPWTYSPLVTFGASIASSAAPGTLFTSTWALSAFANLVWGHAYTYSIAVRDTGTVWSPWSTPRPFTVDAAPNVPSALSPTGGVTFTSFPLLTCTATDLDNTYLDTLTVSGIITRPDATTVTVALAYVSAASQWQFQTTITQLSAYGTYSWKAYAYDGTVYSGAVTVLDPTSSSASSTFAYAAGPQPVITAPANGATVTTSAVAVAWTATGQVKYGVALSTAGGVLLYDTTIVVDAVARTYSLPSGLLRNGDTGVIQVRVIDGSAVTGYSPLVNVVVVYSPAPTITGVSALALKVKNDQWPTAIRIVWTPSSLSSGFGGYYLRRRDYGTLAPGTLVAKITDQNANAFIDYHAPAGVDQVYDLTQLQLLATGETVESVPATVQGRLDMLGIALVSVDTPGTLRFIAPLVATVDEERVRRRKSYDPLGGGAPISVQSATRYWKLPVTVTIVDRRSVGGPAALDQYTDLKTAEESGQTFSYRDERGLRYFVQIDSLVFTRIPIGGWLAKMLCRQEAYSENVAP